MAPTTVVLRPFATAWNMPYWFNCHSLCSTHGFSILSETLGLMVQPSVSLLIVINQFYWLHIRKNNRKKLPTQYGSRTQGLTEMCLQLPSKSIKVVGLLNSMPFFLYDSKFNKAQTDTRLRTRCYPLVSYWVHDLFSSPLHGRLRANMTIIHKTRST